MKKSLLVLVLSLTTLSVTAERLSLQQGVSRAVKPNATISSVASSASGIGTTGVVSGISASTIAGVAAAIAAAVSINSTSSH